jgi:hypothetical protein
MNHRLRAFLFSCLVGIAGAQSAAGPPAASPPVFPLPALTPAETERIDSVIAKFPAAADERANVYFLGFAGYGEERVFAEEIKLAARTVGARLGSTPRTLLLINDRRDFDTWPLATHRNLQYALAALGRVMNPERDVLFLALSSHGGEGGVISVSNVNLEPSGLGARTLGTWLQEAQIRWRVVVVSACFSGAFIERLANNQTIVITAARRDRTSFGCSDQRDLTYFGEAFYRDALPRAPSLRSAFDMTRREIRQREKSERVRPSQPQSHFGPILESKLADLQAAPTH